MDDVNTAKFGLCKITLLPIILLCDKRSNYFFVHFLLTNKISLIGCLDINIQMTKKKHSYAHTWQNSPKKNKCCIVSSCWEHKKHIKSAL